MILFALYDEYDVVSYDGIRRTSEQSLDELNSFLKSDTLSEYPIPHLKWGLLIFGLTYFFSGYSKILNGLIPWLRPTGLGQTILYESLAHIGQLTYFGRLVLEYPSVMAAITFLTLVLELGFIFAIVFKKPYWPFAVGLLGMHLGIGLTMQIWFFDQFLIFPLFLPWDTFFERFSSASEIDLVYDEHCYFCSRSLWVFKHLDLNGSIRFYSQSNLPEQYADREDVDYESAMYVFSEQDSYRGYYAFRRLCAHIGILRPIGWVMSLPMIRHVGERVYEHIAANRSRYGTCAVDS